jgi:PadR family transcriptional regulator, regulatory protein AphA
MSLRHGLIGLLAREGPQTGYQLTKAFDRSVNFVWHAVHGQIYPELARLVDAGFIRQTGTGPRGAKRYEATHEGIAELRRWITEVEPGRGTRNEVLLRTFFVYLVEPDEAEAFFRREAEQYRLELAVLEAFAAERVETPSERASALTVDAGIRVLKARIEWAERAAESAPALAGRRVGAGRAASRRRR